MHSSFRRLCCSAGTPKPCKFTQRSFPAFLRRGLEACPLGRARVSAVAIPRPGPCRLHQDAVEVAASRSSRIRLTGRRRHDPVISHYLAVGPGDGHLACSPLMSAAHCSARSPASTPEHARQARLQIRHPPRQQLICTASQPTRSAPMICGHIPSERCPTAEPRSVQGSLSTTNPIAS
jgi:hypothetical protein